MVVLEADQVTKTFAEGREAVPVLKGVSLQLEPGEIVTLEGPSGSGKTTLLSILGAILTPTGGRVVVNGHEIVASRANDLAAIRRQAIGFVFQQFNLFPALSAVENVEYALNIKGMNGGGARREAEAVLDAVGLAERKHFLRAARNSASPSPARWRGGRRSCWRTSRRRILIRKSGSRSSRCSAIWPNATRGPFSS
jgi:putative ABC transport system ATP-binding protein